MAGEQATPLTVEEIGALHYASRLETDEQLQDLAPAYARIGIDDGYVSDVRAIAAGSASNDLIDGIFGCETENMRRNGAYSCPVGGTDDTRSKMEEWRKDYNTVRSHSAIGNRPPILLMKCSLVASDASGVTSRKFRFGAIQSRGARHQDQSPTSESRPYPRSGLKPFSARGAVISGASATGSDPKYI